MTQTGFERLPACLLVQLTQCVPKHDGDLKVTAADLANSILKLLRTIVRKKNNAHTPKMVIKLHVCVICVANDEAR